jgi:MFS transporter, DHA1 family, inner membrane transport protein
LLLVAFLLLWGTGCFSTNSTQQARLVMLSPPHAPASVAMNSSASPARPLTPRWL